MVTGTKMVQILVGVKVVKPACEELLKDQNITQ
jgi:hypothetical protein